MPTAAPKPCTQCGVLVTTGGSRCAQHQVQAWESTRRKGTRHERGYGSAWDRTRERILQRDVLCQPCLRHGDVHEGREVDHILPRAMGGSDDDSNLQAICRQVHRAKTSAERHGRPWDEAAHYAAHQDHPGGGAETLEACN